MVSLCVRASLCLVELQKLQRSKKLEDRCNEMDNMVGFFKGFMSGRHTFSVETSDVVEMGLRWYDVVARK